MAHDAAPTRVLPIVRNIAIALGMILVVIVLMMYLMGVFRPKVGEAQAEATAGRPVGDAQLAVVKKIRVPVSESAVGTVRPVHETTVASKLLARSLGV